MMDGKHPSMGVSGLISHCGTMLTDCRSIYVVEDAQEDLDALRRAAQVITNPVAYSTDDWLKAWELMKALAKEAT